MVPNQSLCQIMIVEIMFPNVESIHWSEKKEIKSWLSIGLCNMKSPDILYMSINA